MPAHAALGRPMRRARRGRRDRGGEHVGRVVGPDGIEHVGGPECWQDGTAYNPDLHGEHCKITFAAAA